MACKTARSHNSRRRTANRMIYPPNQVSSELQFAFGHANRIAALLTFKRAENFDKTAAALKLTTPDLGRLVGAIPNHKWIEERYGYGLEEVLANSQKGQ